MNGFDGLNTNKDTPKVGLMNQTPTSNQTHTIDQSHYSKSTSHRPENHLLDTKSGLTNQANTLNQSLQRSILNKNNNSILSWQITQVMKLKDDK
jgi:hypothetical protein